MYLRTQTARAISRRAGPVPRPGRLAAGLLGAGQGRQEDGPKMSGGSGQVLAVVNGKPVTEADVRASSAEQFQALEREYQQKVHELLENSAGPGRAGPPARSRGRGPRHHQGAAPRRIKPRGGDRRRGGRLLRAEPGPDPAAQGADRAADQAYLEQQGRRRRARRSSTTCRPSTRSRRSSSRSASRWPPPARPRARRTRR